VSKADVRDFIGFSLFQYSSRTFPRIMAARVSRFSQAALRELFLAALSRLGFLISSFICQQFQQFPGPGVSRQSLRLKLCFGLIRC
jgi:hypothetical protein